MKHPDPLATVATAPMPGLDPAYLAAREKLAEGNALDEPIPKRQYGRTDERLSVIGFGWERRACRQRFQRVGEQRGVVYFAVSFSPSTVDLDLHRLLPCLIPFLLRIAACVVGGVFLPILEDGCP